MGLLEKAENRVVRVELLRLWGASDGGRCYGLNFFWGLGFLGAWLFGGFFF